MEKITSRNNERIKLVVKLNSSATKRKELGLYVLEGVRLCSDALESGVEITEVFFTEKVLQRHAQLISKLTQNAQKNYEITQDVSHRLSETQTPQGVFCICKIQSSLKKKYEIDIKGKYIALENIQDPANLGAIARTAEALGINGAILSNCCDIYNPKAMRASMGSLLRLPVIGTEDLPQLLQNCAEKGMATLCSTPSDGAKDITTIPMETGLICVVGNEGSGVTHKTMSACTNLVTIPMFGRAESLNVATAAAILMWEMLRGGDKPYE